MALQSRDTHWLGDAQCAGMDTDEFEYPEHIRGLTTTEMKSRRWHRAANLCLGCPVIRECAADALDQHDASIIRAGVPIPERGSTPYYRRARTWLQEIADGTPLPVVTARATRCAPPGGGQ